MLVTLGDLAEDIVVELGGPVQFASDTAARIHRRRGGSAANTAEIAAALGHSARFVGQVGADAIGGALVEELAASGVDVSCVRRSGSTGTIVVLVDHDGERTMLTDRRTCLDLDRPDPGWLDGASSLHVPVYSLAGGPLAATTATVIGWAHERGVAVSIDASSVALLEQLGTEHVRELLTELRPDVVLANADEARTLSIDGPLAGAVTVVKRGPGPATVHRLGCAPTDVPALAVEGAGDTTGAGDAFAAGIVTARWRDDPIGACRAGHRAAADLLRRRS